MGAGFPPRGFAPVETLTLEASLAGCAGQFLAAWPLGRLAAWPRIGFPVRNGPSFNQMGSGNGPGRLLLWFQQERPIWPRGMIPRGHIWFGAWSLDSWRRRPGWQVRPPIMNITSFEPCSSGTWPITRQTLRGGTAIGSRPKNISCWRVAPSKACRGCGTAELADF